MLPPGGLPAAEGDPPVQAEARPDRCHREGTRLRAEGGRGDVLVLDLEDRLVLSYESLEGSALVVLPALLVDLAVDAGSEQSDETVAVDLVF